VYARVRMCVFVCVRMWVLWARVCARARWICGSVPMCLLVCVSVCLFLCLFEFQNTATWYNVLIHTATHCNTLQCTVTYCNTLQYSTTHGNTLQHTTPRCNSLQCSATQIVKTERDKIRTKLPFVEISRKSAPSHITEQIE